VKKICVIGGGRWGQNHIRTLASMGNLAAIVDSDSSKIETYRNKYSEAVFYTDFKAAIKQRYDGYVVATPAETHCQIAKQILGNRLNVLVEKPMTLTSVHAQELVALAEEKGVTLMVGHILLFHPAIKKIKEVIDSGKIGELHYIYSTRLNFGTVRTEENVFWSFAPHDISVLNYLTGNNAVKIEAKSSTFLQGNIPDVTLAQLAYPNNVQAHIFVSWLHPFKEQRLVIVGSKGMLSFEDSSAEKNIYFYPKYIAFEEGIPVKVEEPHDIISYEKAQPLEEELRYFINNLGGKAKTANGKSGYEVVKILEDVQQVIEKDRE
jgi:UDP-2-acetamido-3-amino-2,3-dideoxy-glucuronate N-acetyltransferase